jgi:hypothetical protein
MSSEHLFAGFLKSSCIVDLKLSLIDLELF